MVKVHHRCTTEGVDLQFNVKISIELMHDMFACRKKNILTQKTTDYYILLTI